MYSLQDKKNLLILARDSIETHFSGAMPDTKRVSHLDEKRGCFVTLKKHGELRGCIGFPEPVYPLVQAIVEGARAAAFDDPRFPALEQDELPDIQLEISVLTLPELMEVKSPEEYKKKIEIGRHGLIIRSPLGSGLLLPQVPIEWNWDIDEFLLYICRKAGLGPDAWKDPKSRLYRFEADVFSE